MYQQLQKLHIQNKYKLNKINIMTEQITLLDVCKLPDVQIHSKSGLFKYLVNRQNAEMLKLRQNIVRLSYTNKIIGVRGDQVGIISKRLPLKFANKETHKQSSNNKVNEGYFQDTGYIAHQNFYVQPLPTVKKSTSEPKIQKQNYQSKHLNKKIEVKFNSINTITLDTQNEVILYQEQNYKPTKSFRTRTQSMARLKIYEKKQESSNMKINFKTQSTKLEDRKKKSFSNLLKDIKTDQYSNKMITPILHQQNSLFKRYQRLYQKQSREKSPQNQQQNKRYSEQTNLSPQKILHRIKIKNKKNSEQQILVETDE